MARKPARRFTIDDLWRIERIGGASLSPDGAQVVCPLTSHSMEDNSASSALWLLSTLGGAPRRLTHCGDKDGQPAWSPTGEQIAFVARREQQGRKDETPQLYVIAPDGGEARRASDFAPGIEAFKWFPDGKRIAFIAWVWPGLAGQRAQAKRHKAFKERKESGYATGEAQYRYWDHNLPMGRVAHLHVLDVKTGRVRDLFEGSAFELTRASPDAHAFDIAPDGKTICFAFDPQPRKQIDHCLALAEIDLKNGRVETVAGDEAWDFAAPRYSPDGRYIAFVASHQGKRHTMPGHLALLRRASKRNAAPGWQLLSAQWDRSVSAPLRWAEDGDAILFAAEDRGRCHLWRMGIASSEPAIALRGGWVQSFDVASGAEVIVVVADASDHPARVHALRGGEAEPLRLERFNDALLAPFRFRAAEEVTVMGANGDAVQMWLTVPPGFEAGDAQGKAQGRGKGKTWPLLHAIHGGPHAASGDTFHYRWNNQLFAANGYVVAGVNYHGSSGFGHAFLDSITHRWGELELQDVEAATDWLLAQPWADAKRVFASGGSYGGYMVAWMNAHVPPGRYNAYICHAGCFDWTGMFADDAYTWHAQEFGAWYWEDRAKLDAQSPHAFAGTMRTPTLVIHGALDYRVPDAQGLAYYNTLQAKGVDARLLWFPDENHWVLKPRNSRQWHEEFFGWLARHDAAARR
ncbi:MAG: S9 family peptidase [Ideonella sp.]|nr:S9 family peptidase [Ideonella sp.]